MTVRELLKSLLELDNLDLEIVVSVDVHPIARVDTDYVPGRVVIMTGPI
ncbi:MAG TPA: hypothetical protein VGJ60_07515 [Chloroflexota bacterium]